MTEPKVPRVDEPRALRRNARIGLAASGVAGIIGVCLFLWGQGLGALLLPLCNDYARETLTRRCQQPVLLVKTGMCLLAAALFGGVATSAWALARRWRR